VLLKDFLLLLGEAEHPKPSTRSRAPEAEHPKPSKQTFKREAFLLFARAKSFLKVEFELELINYSRRCLFFSTFVDKKR
jgi:hypothetical protein